MQSTWHPIICEFSNCASSCTYFHIHCNRLAILSFSDFEIVHFSASLSTLIAIIFLSYHFLILKLCVVLQLIPNWLQSTWHPIILEFSNYAPSCTSFHIHCNPIAILSFSNPKIVRCPAFHSTFIAIDLTSDHLWIFKLCVFLHLFPHSLQSTCYHIIL